MQEREYLELSDDLPGNVNKRHLFIVTLQYFVKYVQKDFIMCPYDYKIKAILKSKNRKLKNI